MHIRKAEQADLPDIATISTKALDDDPYNAWLAPHRHKHYHDHRQGFLRRVKKRFHSGMLILVMVTDSQDVEWNGREEVIGHATMECSTIKVNKNGGWYGTIWDKFNFNLVWLEEQLVWYFHLDRSISRTNTTKYWQLAANEDPLKDLGDHWELVILMVDPKFQRRGIGAALLEASKRVAIDDKLSLGLTASKIGKGLYLKHGFREVGTINMGAEFAPVMVFDSVSAGKSPHQ